MPRNCQRSRQAITKGLLADETRRIDPILCGPTESRGRKATLNEFSLVVQQSGAMLEHFCTLTIGTLRIQTAQAESTRAAAQRLQEANRTFLQASATAWTELLVGSVLPYYRERPEQPAARPSSQESIEESEFLNAASTVVRDHRQALRELSKH